jgi:hypothetical protein
MFYVKALSPWLVKVWRIARPISARGVIERPALSNCTAMLYTIPLIVTQLFILIVFSIVDPTRQSEELGVGDGVGIQQITCEQQRNTFLYTQLVYDGKNFFQCVVDLLNSYPNVFISLIVVIRFPHCCGVFLGLQNKGH